MSRVIKIWSSAAAQISKRDDRPQITTDDAVDEISALLDRLTAEAAAVVVQIIAALPFVVHRAEIRHADKWAQAVKAQSGLEITAMLDRISGDPAVKAQVQWASSLIRDVSDQARIWVSEIIIRGNSQQLSAAEMGKQIERKIGVSKRRAKLIAADQANKLAATFDKIRQTEAGVSQYKWRHSRKLNGREDHQAREGKIYSWNKPPSDGHPRSLPYCGCVAQAFIPLMDEIGGQS